MLVEYQTIWHVYISATALIVALLAIILRFHRWHLLKFLILAWVSLAFLMPSLEPEAENWRVPALIKWAFLQGFSEKKGEVPFPAEIVALGLLMTVGMILLEALFRFIFFKVRQKTHKAHVQAKNKEPA